MWWIVWVATCCVGFFTVIGVAIWTIARGSDRMRPLSGVDESPLDLAKKRLAEGEISRQDFEKIKSTLEA